MTPIRRAPPLPVEIYQISRRQQVIAVGSRLMSTYICRAVHCSTAFRRHEPLRAMQINKQRVHVRMRSAKVKQFKNVLWDAVETIMVYPR